MMQYRQVAWAHLCPGFSLHTSCPLHFACHDISGSVMVQPQSAVQYAQLHPEGQVPSVSYVCAALLWSCWHATHQHAVFYMCAHASWYFDIQTSIKARFSWICGCSSCFRTRSSYDMCLGSSTVLYCYRHLQVVDAGTVQSGHAARACFHHDTLQGAQLYTHGEHASQSSQASHSPASPQPKNGPSGADWHSPCQAICNCPCCHGIPHQRLRVSVVPFDNPLLSPPRT